MNQWYALLVDAFGLEVGILGGGYHELRDLTVTTYDSAYIYAAEYGNCFDFIIFDEVHHLPGPKYRQIPLLSTAWYRLGLTATYERQDDAHQELDFFVGPVVYRKQIADLKGDYLSDYEVIRLRISLSEDEAARYAAHAKTYYAFLKKSGLKPHGSGWAEFVKKKRLQRRCPRRADRQAGNAAYHRRLGAQTRNPRCAPQAALGGPGNHFYGRE
jgi:superfamily II DNA or RNA helicase